MPSRSSFVDARDGTVLVREDLVDHADDNPECNATVWCPSCLGHHPAGRPHTHALEEDTW